MRSREGPRHLPGENQERKTETRAGMLKRQFRALVKAITHKAPGSQPAARRRRTEETGKAFRMTARTVVRRTRIPAAAYRAAAYIWDTLDWLNPWHDAGSTNEVDADCQHSEQHYLSLHL